MWLAGGDQHGFFPHPRPPPSAAEGQQLKAGALQQGAEGAAAPELDVATDLEGGEVAIELAAGGEGQVFEVAVIRGWRRSAGRRGAGP